MLSARLSSVDLQRAYKNDSQSLGVRQKMEIGEAQSSTNQVLETLKSAHTYWLDSCLAHLA